MPTAEHGITGIKTPCYHDQTYYDEGLRQIRPY